METQKQQPLYKRLNEVRTQGIWSVGYGHASNSLGLFTKKMLDEGLSEHPICLVSPIETENETDKANAEYTALAVNNLASLAEALGNLHHACMMDSDIPTAWWSKHKETVAKAKEALNKIS